MPLGPAIADDHGAAVPRIARAIVVAMEEERARFEIAWRPQPEELVEIALGRRLRFARADGPDAPAAVARSGPVGAGFDALSQGRQPSRPLAVLRHARIPRTLGGSGKRCTVRVNLG